MSEMATAERRAALKVNLFRSIANEDQRDGNMWGARFWREQARGHIQTIRILRGEMM